MSTSNVTSKGQHHINQRRYPPELRERAVRMVREAIAEGRRELRSGHPGGQPAGDRARVLA
jgi:transposase-like protein